MSTSPQSVATGTLTIALDRIHVPANVRSLDPEHVDALAGSIGLQGLLVPVVVSAASGEVAAGGWDYQLVAGFHRLAAVTKLGHGEIAAVIRDGATEAQDRGIENIARKDLDPYEQAVAVAAMLAKGLTEDGAAIALGWPKQRVTARMKLLELPERAQQLTGRGVIPLAAVDPLRTIGQVSPELLDVLVEHVASDDGAWVARQLATDPGRALADALRHSNTKTFAAYLTTIAPRELEELRLGKKAAEELAEAEKLHRQIDRHAYGPPQIRFNDDDVDQARAAGVLIELDGTAAIITDRPLYRELCKQASHRTVEQLRARAAQLAAERTCGNAVGRPADPEAEARRDRGRQLRALAEQAHGANLDLGWGLMNNLAVIDPATDMNCARFFVYSALGADHDSSPYSSVGDRVAELAACGIRLVIEEFRTDVTKTRRDGTRGAMRIDYGTPKELEKPIAWLWRFVDAARTPAELYGRGLVVVCAEQYASRLVIPVSQQHPPIRWSSHKDHARKALAKLAGPHLPATLKQLEKAIAKVHADTRTPRAPARVPAAAVTESGVAVDADRLDGEPAADDDIEADEDELVEADVIGGESGDEDR